MAIFLRRLKLPRNRRATGAMALLAGLCAAPLAQAQIGSARYSSIVVDNSTGRVLEQANPDAPRYPASLTKLMTLYVAFEALRDHRITLGQTVPVSDHAAGQEPSKLGLRPGTRFTVSDAIQAIVTKSANDAACALGELIGGDETHFAQMMTMRARALGMTQSTFRNASGLPDPDQVTTARDLALLAHHLINDFPNQYHYFSEPIFYFHGRPIPNHDNMLQAYEGADGLKTGYIKASGHNLVTSALRGNVRLIGVVMGAQTNPERDIHMANLLDDGFEALGVPIARHAPGRFHMPTLIASAQAGTLTPAMRRAARHRGLHPALQLAALRGPAPKMKLAALAPHHLATTHAVATCAAHTLHHGCTLHPKLKRKT